MCEVDHSSGVQKEGGLVMFAEIGEGLIGECSLMSANYSNSKLSLSPQADIEGRTCASGEDRFFYLSVPLFEARRIKEK